MSRLYSIAIGSAAVGGAGPGYTFTNQRNGQLDPNALMVEFDLLAAPYAAPAGQSSVKVYGVPLTPQGGWPGINQASDLNKLPITITGGMQKGLPLATADASQSGLLMSGSILQAFGNWMGVAQTLDFVITADGGPGAANVPSQANPGNFVMCWNKGEPLASAIQSTLSSALPGIPVNINISSNLVLAEDEVHVAQTIQQFASYVKAVSQSIGGANYPGVDLWLGNGIVNVFDGSANSDTKQVNFVDLIGQPTWMDAFIMQFNCVMRADLQIGDKVGLPQLAGFQAQTTPQSNSQARNKSAFDGTWTIDFIRHVGNSRAPDAMSWITTYQAYSNQAPDTVTSPLNSSA